VDRDKRKNEIKRPALTRAESNRTHTYAGSSGNSATTGILIVGHGSRREEANADVREAARQIGKLGGFPLIETAFLEITTPTIADGFGDLVARGARHVIVHPYFLSPGRHTRGDIPLEVSDAAARHARISYEITQPLAAHRFVIEASIERIRETAGLSARLNIWKELNRGKVYLVGAGPGDPGLLTIKALELLRQADSVVYDYLVNPELLNHANEAEHIHVGKVGGGRQTPQHEINNLLISRASEGKIVVRLKGGDPFLFGRGAEESLALRDAGIPFEIVPGVSSALAVPAYAGIPLTHRSLSSSIAIVTGARAGDGDFDDKLLRVHDADTIVVLMGISHLRKITDKLIKVGRSPETPAAVIRWGTYESQQIVTGKLTTIADLAEAERLRAPAVIVIGEVVRLHESLNWFGKELDAPRELEFSVAS